MRFAQVIWTKVCYNVNMEELEEVEVEYPLTSASGKKYREYVMDGRLVHEFEKSGVIRDAKTMDIIRGYIHKGNAKSMQLRGVESKKRRAVDVARDGLLRGVSATEIARDWRVAWEYIVAAQAELAMQPAMGSSSTKAAEFIARMADLDPTRQREQITLSDGKNSISLNDVPPERLEYLLSALNNRGTHDDTE